jgi:hypothetical protein
MPQRSLHSWALAEFACWLVLLASADDFNLARFVLPLADVNSERLLPLDDPNTDFNQASEFREPPTTSWHPYRCTTSDGQGLIRAVLTSRLVVLTPGHPPRPSGNTPLRC